MRIQATGEQPVVMEVKKDIQMNNTTNARDLKSTISQTLTYLK